MDFVVTLNGAEHTISTSDAAVLAAIAGLRQRFNTKAGSEVLTSDQAYVQKTLGDWAERNVGFSQADLDAVVSSAFASWVNQFNPVVESPVELTGDALKTFLKAYAAAKRYAIETGGISVAGLSVATDRQTQAILSATVQAFQLGLLTGSIDWKASNGWVALDQPTITAIASSVLAHVQGAFSKERAVNDAIDAGTITTVLGIDAFAWS